MQSAQYDENPRASAEMQSAQYDETQIAKYDPSSPYPDEESTDSGSSDEDGVVVASGADIEYWEFLQDKARCKAARKLEKSTRLEHDIDFLDTLDKSGGFISTHNPPSYFDEAKDKKAFVPGVGAYELHKKRSSANGRSQGLLGNGAPDRDLWGAEVRHSASLPSVGKYNHTKSSLSSHSLPLPRSKMSSAEVARHKHQKSMPGPGRYFISGDISKVKVGPVMSSSMRGKNEFDLAMERSLELPAPDTYTLPQIGSDIRGGIISTAVPPRSMDLAEAHGKTIPGPGQYSPKQDRVGFNVGGGKISEARPQSDVDVMQRRAKELPGPGEYDVPNTLRRSGGVISESRIPPLFKDQLRIAREGPSPGTYADGILKSSLKLRGAPVGKARMKRFYEDNIERSKAVPGPGGNTEVQSTLAKSGGLFSTARPKSDVEWRIHRAKQIPGPKYVVFSKLSVNFFFLAFIQLHTPHEFLYRYTITNPDTTAMDKIKKDAIELYRDVCVVLSVLSVWREVSTHRSHATDYDFVRDCISYRYGTSGEDPYKLKVKAKASQLPAHERLYMRHAPIREIARRQRSRREQAGKEPFRNRAKLYAYSDKYAAEKRRQSKLLTRRTSGDEETAIVAHNDPGDATAPNNVGHELTRSQSSNYLLLDDPVEDDEIDGDREAKIDCDHDHAKAENMMLVAHAFEGYVTCWSLCSALRLSVTRVWCCYAGGTITKRR